MMGRAQMSGLTERERLFARRAARDLVNAAYRRLVQVEGQLARAVLRGHQLRARRLARDVEQARLELRAVEGREASIIARLNR